MKYMKWFLGLAVLAFVGCGIPTGSMGSLTINMLDRVLAGQSVLPEHSLVADHYDLHGAGSSGAAAGSTFDVTITSAGTMQIDLLPGDWTLTATAKNGEDLAIGGGTASATIAVGVPSTIGITCLPYAGDGTVNASFSWVPDILAVPSAEAELVGFDSVNHPIPMFLDSSTAAHGSLTLAQGWYTAYERIRDNGVLAAGIVKALRVAANMNTDWASFLTVNQLQGQVTIDLSWQGGPPLILTATPTPGDAPLYDGSTLTFTITGSDKDSGASLVYAWYLNGDAVAVSSSASYTADSADFLAATHAYLSAVVFQSDGKRAGDAQWLIMREAWPPTAYQATIDIEQLTVGNTHALVFNLDGSTAADYRDTYESVDHHTVHTFELAAGSYKLGASIEGGATAYYGGANFASATVFTIPVLPPVSVSMYGP